MAKQLVGLLLLLLTGCTPLRQLPPIPENFDGIKTSVDQRQAVSLLFIHGMGGYSDGDPGTLIRAIKQTLHLCEIDRSIRPLCRDGETLGHLTRYDFLGSRCPSCLHIYVLDWTQATEKFKANLHFLDAKCANPHRLPMIGRIKQGVLDNGIADAVLYLSREGVRIQYPTAQAIKIIEEETGTSSIIVIGFSLGNEIILDTLDAMRGYSSEFAAGPADAQAAERFITHMSGFFMLSNSSPLFGLDGCWTASPLARFITFKRAYDPDFQIVSLGDPNDTLHYRISNLPFPASYGCKNVFLNADVQNTRACLFGYINPVTAHTEYGRNEDVINLIIFGNYTNK